MTHPWLDRVAQYLDLLQQCIEKLNETMDETRLGTTQLNAPSVESSTVVLTRCLEELERLIADRQLLLHDPEAPLSGVSLRDVLNRCGLAGSDGLAVRCQKLSNDVDLSRERAVALFVCQFHLGEMASHLLGILRNGGDFGATYERGKSEIKRSGSGSSIFNKAA